MEDGVDVEDEYKVWKKNSCFLYDLILTHRLDWPSLTCEWLPGIVRDKYSKKQRAIIGTHTSNQDIEGIKIVEITTPIADNQEEVVYPTLKVIKKIPHIGEVCKARYMPQRPEIVATKTSTGKVSLFNHVKEGEKENFLFELGGGDADGYGLDWSVCGKGLLASCGEDKILNMWKVDFQSTNLQKPFRSVNVGECLEDVSWNKFNPNVIAVAGGKSVGVRLFDIRKKNSEVTCFGGHTKEVYGVDFHPFQDFMFASASGDHSVKLWDTRNPKYELGSLDNHSDEVYTCRWSLINEGLLATAGKDRRVMLWDIRRIGEEQTSDEARDGPAELLFVHSGHRDAVNDVSLNCEEDSEWFVLSVSSMNYVHMWEILDHIYNPDLQYFVHDDELE